MDTSTTSRTIDIRKQCAIVIRKPKLRIFDEYEALVNYIKSNPNGSQADWLQERETAKLEQTQRFQDIIFTKGIPTNDSRRILQDVGDVEISSEIIASVPTGLGGKLGINPFLSTAAKTVSNDYWYIVANGNIDIKNQDTVMTITGNPNAISSTVDQSGVQKTDTVGNFSTDSDVCNSVISVSIDQTTESAWTGTITLDNSNDIYYLQNQQITSGFIPYYFQRGDCVIESNDEIDVYLTDWDGNLKQTFTGYVNSVTMSDNGLQKRVTLQCEDCTKKLSVSRSNLNPSLDPNEALGNTITPYTLSYAESTPVEVIKTILGSTYCNVLTDFDFIKANWFLIQTMRGLEVATISRQDAFKTFQENILNKIKDPKYMTQLPNGTIMGYEYTATGLKRLRFVVEGINQQAWNIALNNGGWDLKTSQWKGNDEVINDIVGRIFYEFYCDENGVIHVRPTNLTLPKKLSAGSKAVSAVMSSPTISSNQGLTNTTVDNTSLYNQTIENYIITVDKELYIRNFNQTFNDRSIFTDIVITGDFQWQGLRIDTMVESVPSNYKWRKMLGSRMAPQETKIGAITSDQIKSYGVSRLARHNSEAWTASITMEGNSRIAAGKPIFVERWEAVYYVNGVNHSFTSGEDYTTTLTLTNRRKPIAYILSKDNLKQKLNLILSSLVANNTMSSSEAANVKANAEALQWGTVRVPIVSNASTNITSALSSVGTSGLSTVYKIVWESIPTNFSPDQIQSLFVTAEMYRSAISVAKQTYDDALTSGSKAEIDDAYQTYEAVLYSAEESYGAKKQNNHRRTDRFREQLMQVQ